MVTAWWHKWMCSAAPGRFAKETKHNERVAIHNEMRWIYMLCSAASGLNWKYIQRTGEVMGREWMEKSSLLYLCHSLIHNVCLTWIFSHHKKHTTAAAAHHTLGIIKTWDKVGRKKNVKWNEMGWKERKVKNTCRFDALSALSTNLMCLHTGTFYSMWYDADNNEVGAERDSIIKFQ